MKDNDQTFVTITNQNIYDELIEQRKINEATLEQAKKTNGRVTNLEGKSLGLWISNHPFKFAMALVGVISLVADPVRSTLIALISKFI